VEEGQLMRGAHVLLLAIPMAAGYRPASRPRHTAAAARVVSPLLQIPSSSRWTTVVTPNDPMSPKHLHNQLPGDSTIMPTRGLNATTLYERANLLLQTHSPEEAAILLQRLTRLTPNNGKVWMKLANVYRKRRNYKDGERTLRRAVETCPSNALLRQALADFCRERRRYAEARSHYREAMKLEPSLASVYDSWGRMEATLGHSGAAAALFERGLKLQPSARLCHALGVLLDRQGASGQARTVLTRGLQLPGEETNPQLQHALAMVEVRAGNSGAARALFSMVIDQHPRFTMAHLSLGQLEERLGNLQAARRHYEAGATTPQRGGQLGAVQLWQSWARIEFRLERTSAALATYKRATQLYPKDAQLLVGWAKLEGEYGDAGRARSLFERATSSATAATPYAFQCAAALEQRAGDAAAARSLLRRGAALVLDDDETAKSQMLPLLHAWAVLEWRDGERRQARSLFDRAEAAGRAPCGWLLQWRARFEGDTGHSVLARHYYARAVNAAPLDVSAWHMWAEFEAEQGDEKRATVLSKHAQFVETQALLANALSGGARSGATQRSPLSAADMYTWASPPKQ